MRKIYSNKITPIIFLSIAIGFIILGISLHISAIFLHKDSIAIYGPLITSPLFSLIFGFGYYAEKSTTLEMDDNSINFHYFVFAKPKIKYDKKNGLIVNYENIKEFYSEFHKGDWIYSADTTWYFFVLKDNTKIQFSLFRLGKKNEKEISELLNKYLKKYKIRRTYYLNGSCH